MEAAKSILRWSAQLPYFFGRIREVGIWHKLPAPVWQGELEPAPWDRARRRHVTGTRAPSARMLQQFHRYEDWIPLIGGGGPAGAHMHYLEDGRSRQPL